MMIDRYLTDYIVDDLGKKMVFVGGPRQVGKTTLARDLVAKSYRNPTYYNWDFREDRKNIMESSWPGEADLIILDEIHKYRMWKSHLKGIYDKLSGKFRFLVTGSARLDLFRRGGDSLQGRYHYYRFHPLSLAEISGRKSLVSPQDEISFGQEGFDTLIALDRFGGFPEPFIGQDERTLRRWHNEKIERLFREDIRDTERINDIGSMKLLSDILPDKIGSTLSINSLREDLEVSHRAVSHWLDVLESFYYCFRIYPYSKNVSRSIKKEPKLYLLDWSEVQDEAARFENLVATHLLKFIHLLYDRDGYRTRLSYLRNLDKKELDFLVSIDDDPWFAVEAKLNDTAVSPHMLYFRERLKIPYLYQVVKKHGIDTRTTGVRIISADRFLTGLA